MHLVSDTPPSLDLVITPNAGRITESTGRGSGYECSLRDEQSSWYGSSLGVVFFHQGCGSAVVGGTQTGERSHSDAVLEMHVAYFEGLEEIGLRHG